MDAKKSEEDPLLDEDAKLAKILPPYSVHSSYSDDIIVEDYPTEATLPYAIQGCSTYDDISIISPESINDEDNVPTTALPTCMPSLKVYKRRWIIIGIFCLLCVMENAVWNTWGPIAITAENYFHWGNTVIADLNNWGNINVLLFIMPAVWLLDSKGRN